jgi:stage V sporulation protein B
MLAGTILLTLSGLLTRFIGFFYRIFLSHTIGAEGMGIYQLIFPILAFTFAFTAFGINSSISKYVAEATAHTEKSPSGKPAAYTYLYAGLMLSLFLSFLCAFFLYRYADFFAQHVLAEARCTPLLKILALTIPISAIHSSINGYYYGLQKTVIPAVSQLLEQIARVGGVWVIYQITLEQGRPVSINMAVWGLVIGEIASVLFCITFTRFKRSQGNFPLALGQIITLSAPITANRTVTNLMQSAEAILIPVSLRSFGYTSSEALSVYGVLTGMALPMVLFPSVITNSVSVMLLPAISEAEAKENRQYVKNAVKRTCIYCIILGLACTFVFLIIGKWLGMTIFANELAGTLIVILGWICPFLYLNTTLSSILHGLGKTQITFLISVTGCSIRIIFVLFFIPLLGIKSYLWGMLTSHLVMAALAVLYLYKIIFKRKLRRT